MLHCETFQKVIVTDCAFLVTLQCIQTVMRLLGRLFIAEIYGEPLKGNRSSLLGLGKIDLLDGKAHFICANHMCHSYKSCTLFLRYDFLFTQISSLNGRREWDNLVSGKCIILQLLQEQNKSFSTYSSRKEESMKIPLVCYNESAL